MHATGHKKRGEVPCYVDFVVAVIFYLVLFISPHLR